MEARQMTPFFSSTFSAMFVTFICEFEKYSIFTSIFGQKLLIWKADHNFLERRHPEVKTPKRQPISSTRRSQIPSFLGSSSWTITLTFAP